MAIHLRSTKKVKFALNDYELKKLLKYVSKKDLELAKAIKMAVYEGRKISYISEKIDVNKRTLQRKIEKMSNEIIGKKITFEHLRFTCLIRFLNKGYELNYVSELFGYSSKDILDERRNVAGIITPSKRLKVFKRNKFKCVFCNRSDLPLEIDHIIPITKGGTSRLLNLQTLCNLRNSAKSNDLIQKIPLKILNNGGIRSNT